MLLTGDHDDRVVPLHTHKVRQGMAQRRARHRAPGGWAHTSVTESELVPSPVRARRGGSAARELSGETGSGDELPRLRFLPLLLLNSLLPVIAPAQLTAQLQHVLCQPGSAQQNPIVARIDTKSGHGAGKSTQKARSAELVSLLSYYEDQRVPVVRDGRCIYPAGD